MLTGKYDVHYVIFKLSYPVAREREIIKGGFWQRLTHFGALLWCTPRFMQDRKSKHYNFTIYYIDHKTVGTLR